MVLQGFPGVFSCRSPHCHFETGSSTEVRTHHQLALLLLLQHSTRLLMSFYVHTTMRDSAGWWFCCKNQWRHCYWEIALECERTRIDRRWGGQVTKGGGVDILVYIGLWDAAFKKPVRFIIPWSAIDIPTKNPILLWSSYRMMMMMVFPHPI